ncbi:enoyl-CoA hydratase/isomerase family protein [Chondromyces crocatus]|uniref:3-hydroxyisobutyryl-CoA hydrolase n=1 Tax=Chondromyces crocatus TaxID=52 RepID=A0A0K1ELN8_CHOCO|nr:enoyl-CoA hydratase/isomerase family protein [Chondromyces crocatus]AKT41784.1 enoyl-CoA hydratase [Chondromyces crocatus]
MSKDVRLETRGPLGVVTLDRPKALNALDLGMIREIAPRLEAWERDPEVKAVVIRSAGGKAFCAGGDVRAVAVSVGASSPAGEEPLHLAYFREEYALNHRIHRYAKPFIALVDGISMGGGLGLSLHGSHRVVTERLMFAMPETAIGLFPDVGGGWFLPRFPGEAGTYLGLTGARCNAADALWLGYATHHVPQDRLDALLDALTGARWDEADAHGLVSETLARFTTDPGASPLRAHAEVIDRCFAADRVEDILDALAAEGSAWSEATRSTLSRMSPSALKVTLRHLRLCRGLPYEDVKAIETHLSEAMALRHDFREGIRAVLVDKDHAPRWKPATLAEVTDEDVASCFVGARALTTP